MKKVLTLAIICLMAAPAAAQIVDGSRDANYGAPKAVQTVQTQFGDNDGTGNSGGELDAGYARVWNGRLYVLLTGNQEHNFNKMDIFIDSVAGGENTLSDIPDYDFDPGGGNWISGNLGGLTFDDVFDADYHVFTRFGNTGGVSDAFELDIVDRAGGASASVNGDGGSTGGTGPIQSGTIAPGAGGNNTTSFITQNVDFAINNTNNAGVLGGTGDAAPDNPQDVMTGIEFSVALADIGNPAIGSDILISAMYNNGDHNFLSNQVLGGLPVGTGNLGGDGGGTFTGNLAGVNFNQFPGLQYFSVTVVPEPASVALLGLATIGALCTRRR